MTHGSHLLLRLFLCLLALGIIGLSVRLILKVKSRVVWTSPGDMVRAAAKKTSKPLGWLTIGALLGIPIGWNLHRPSEIKRLDNVLVQKVRPDGTFRSSADGVEDFETETCQPNDFHAGERFTYWKYRNKPGCKEMVGQGLGFHAVTDQVSGKRIIFPTKQETADAR